MLEKPVDSINSMNKDYPNGAYYARSNLSHWNSQGRRESAAYAGSGEFLWDRKVLYLTELIIEMEIGAIGFEPGGRRFESFRARQKYQGVNRSHGLHLVPDT